MLPHVYIVTQGFFSSAVNRELYSKKIGLDIFVVFLLLLYFLLCPAVEKKFREVTRVSEQPTLFEQVMESFFWDCILGNVIFMWVHFLCQTGCFSCSVLFIIAGNACKKISSFISFNNTCDVRCKSNNFLCWNCYSKFIVRLRFLFDTLKLDAVYEHLSVSLLYVYTLLCICE